MPTRANKTPKKKLASKTVTRTVRVKCMACGSMRDIHADEIPKGDHPMCTICCMPMIPHSATSKSS